MVLPEGFAEDGRRPGVSLAGRTGLRVGGRPELFYEPRTSAEAGEIVRRLAAAGVPVRYLGGGYNLLVADGPLDGAVLTTRRIRFVRVHGDRVEVGAGCSFPGLVRRAIHLRIPVLPGCPGIPGTVGGVVFMNAGGRFGTVGDALLDVEGLDAEGRPFRRRVLPGEMGYRSSPFRGCLITGATFRRDPDLDPARLRRLHDEALGHKQRTQPLGARSAGCIFKNPDGPAGQRSAGFLIEQAGLKGRRVGGAAVSEVHANFIVNEGGATADDVRSLIAIVRAGVRERFGVDLELEVEVWDQARPPGPGSGRPPADR
jgi:UDP-N-acetylmuramate dehydrogenase